MSFQVDLFEKTFGDSVVVTVKRSEKVANLFNWDWAARLLDDQGRSEYNRDDAAALAECQRVIAPAWAEYERVEATAIAAARAEYQRVKAAAWATAFINMHKRGAGA